MCCTFSYNLIIYVTNKLLMCYEHFKSIIIFCSIFILKFDAKKLKMFFCELLRRMCFNPQRMNTHKKRVQYKMCNTTIYSIRTHFDGRRVCVWWPATKLCHTHALL